MSSIKLEQFIDPQDKLWEFVENIVKGEGFSLYDIIKPRQGLLRVFIDSLVDSPAGDSKRGSGVNADDCITVCRRLMDALAVEGSALGVGASPDLEVSSPGLDRVMRLDEHFSSGIGSKVKLWLEGEAVTGVLEDYKMNTLYFKGVESAEVSQIPFSDVRKAQKIF